MLLGAIGGGVVVLGLLIGLGVWAFQTSGAGKEEANANEKDFPQVSPIELAEKLLNELVANENEQLDLLREVKDAESAKKVAPRLKKSMLELIQLSKQITSQMIPDKAKEQELKDKFKPVLQVIMTNLNKEMIRVKTGSGRGGD